jgi:hypothetical protein
MCFNQVLFILFFSSVTAISLHAHAFYYFIPHTTPFNYGTIEIKIKNYYMGPILTYICIPPPLGTFYTQITAVVEEEKNVAVLD